MGLDTDKLLGIVTKRIDLPGALADIMDEVLEPALQKLVDDSATPYDNMAKTAMYPPLSAALKEELTKLWAKLQPSV